MSIDTLCQYGYRDAPPSGGYGAPAGPPPGGGRGYGAGGGYGGGPPPPPGGYDGGRPGGYDGGRPGGGYDSGGYGGASGGSYGHGGPGGFAAGPPPNAPASADPQCVPYLTLCLLLLNIDYFCRLWQWFTSVDADRSGAITAEELQQCLINGDWSRESLFDPVGTKH